MELKKLLRLSCPIIVSMLLDYSLNLEDQMLVGQFLSAEDLAAAALGITWFNFFWYFLVGMMSAAQVEFPMLSCRVARCNTRITFPEPQFLA